MRRIDYGKDGEEIAIGHLRKKHYEIVDVNYRTKCGEIDIIARDGKINVFVEVKRRKNIKMGHPGESVNYYKQMHIIRSAYMYVKRFKMMEQPMRFDVIEIVGNHVTHYKDAFQVPSVGWFL